MQSLTKYRLFQAWICLCAATLFASSQTSPFFGILLNDNRCRLSPNPKETIFNLNHYCDYKQLLDLYHALPAGRFPATHKPLKGHVLLCPGGGCALFEQIAQQVWNGKGFIQYVYGAPNERGVVYNRILHTMELFHADIFRTLAPIDNRPSFLIDYQRDPFTFFINDYIRQVSPNLYLGIMTIRWAPRVPVLFFMLEILP